MKNGENLECHKYILLPIKFDMSRIMVKPYKMIYFQHKDTFCIFRKLPLYCVITIHLPTYFSLVLTYT